MADRKIVGGVDAYVAQAAPSANRNGPNYMLIQNGSSGNTNRGFLFIKAPAPVQAGVTVISARLVLHLRSASHPNLTFHARAVASSWKARKITWNNQPDVVSGGLLGTAAVGSVTGAEKDSIVEFDVTNHMQAVADGAAWFGWRLVLAEENRWATVVTSEGVSEWRRPRLIVEYSNAPAPPVDLSPSGGRMVSIENPIFRYSYLDYGGSRELMGHQIQIRPTGETTGDDFDTGAIPASEPEWDSSDSSWSIANGGSWRWRVRSQDAAGLWSKWSDWAHFERLNKGSLTLNNPGEAPNDFVQDVTPPITWTHSGPWSQEAWQVIVQQQSLAGWYTIHNTGKRAGNDDSYTLPRGVLTTANWSTSPGTGWDVPTRYRVAVRTWDGQGRQATPGDPAWYHVRREFEVHEGATANVENLTVEQLGAWPFAILRWERATAPDYFHIARGGNIIKTVTPDEVDQGDGTYQWIDMKATLNRPHTWAILPVVNGVMSTVESTFIRTEVKSKGIWLLDPDRPFQTAVMINGLGGDADLTMQSEDQVEDHEVIGRSTPVRVINSVGLAKGSVSGVVSDYSRIPNVAKLEWRDRLRDLKAQPGKRLRLVTMDYNMPVVVNNVSDWPNPIEDVIEVSFDFIQDNVPSWLRS